MTKLVLLNCLLALIIIVTSDRIDSDNYYNVAVVGMNNKLKDVEPNITVARWLLLMTNRYSDLVEEAYNISGQDLDIILFPESSLQRDDDPDYSTEVPEPHAESLCRSSWSRYAEFLKELACISKRFNTTIVINLIEKFNCKMDKYHCPKSGTKYYNTNVALNETGYVTGRYRKWNLFGERLQSPAAEPEVVTLTTKKGHVFGMFTCFDIIFDKPALDLVRREGIKNVLFPNRWYSELPFLTALQVQQMWAQENNVTLIASGFNEPTNASWGTGIFVGTRSPAYIQLNYGDDPMIGVSSVSDIILSNTSQRTSQDEALPEDYDINLKNFSIWKDISIPQYRSEVLKTHDSEIFQEICDGVDEKLCCQFNITISKLNYNKTINDMNTYRYHLVAFNGIRSFSGVRQCGIELCGLIACLNDSLDSCGQRYTDPSNVFWKLSFERINVSATFSTSNDRIQYPNSLLSNLSPISPTNTQWTRREIDSGTVMRSHVLETPVRKLLTFGIYGRVFSRDDSVKTMSGSKILQYSPLLLYLIIIVYFVL